MPAASANVPKRRVAEADAWRAVVASEIVTVLAASGHPDALETLLALARGEDDAQGERVLGETRTTIATTRVEKMRADP